MQVRLGAGHCGLQYVYEADTLSFKFLYCDAIKVHMKRKREVPFNSYVFLNLNYFASLLP